jgi:putative salt-induced outer membrane protein
MDPRGGGGGQYVRAERLALQVKMTDVLALAVGFSVRHNTDPPVGFEETDTLMTVNLVYEIK